jgi:uncharacterized protein (DUF1800 family)
MHHNLRTRLGVWVAGIALSVSAVSPVLADTAPTPRQQVQHLLRRFAFSGSPAMVSQVLAQGTSAWVDQQLNWSTIDDSKSMLNTPPHAYANPNNCNFCLPNYYAFEALVYQHNMLTNRQIQAKMELHWLEHFSVNTSNIDPPNMYNYDQIVRANALGNFATLVSQVATTPAMLQWLNNAGNQAKGPNVNWGRELMQLYTTGVWQLNPDGSQVLKGGQPVLNYVGADIKAMAKAMSGYNVIFLQESDPMKNYMVTFNTQNQIGGKVTFLGGEHTIPRNATAIATIVNFLAHQPSTAPFEVTELLKRFVTETPSKKYISDIVAVWNANVDAPDQLAKVVKAIILHPEFNTAYHTLPKQPLEKVFGALRQLPGKMQASAPAACGTFQQYQQAGQSLEGMTNEAGQELFYPPNVFSFFIPGHVETTNTTSSVTGLTDVYAQLLERSPPQSDTCSGTGADVWIDVPTLIANIHSTNGRTIANYLLDALVDGGSVGLRGTVYGLLGSTPSNTTIQSAVWLILNSPEYAVN